MKRLEDEAHLLAAQRGSERVARHAVWLVVIATVWQASGLVMAMMLAALRGIDGEIWKAARLDGIPTWRVYVSIVLPMLGPAIATVFLLLSTMVVKLYDAVVAMTQGGPGYSTTTLVIYVYRQAFENFAFGYASAIGVVWLLLLLAFAVAYLRVARP